MPKNVRCDGDGRCVGDARGEAGGEGVQEVFDRRRAAVEPTSTGGWSASEVVMEVLLTCG